MADVLPFKKPKQAKPAANKGNTLCKNGHHKWVIQPDRRFDVKEGRLLTLFECSRCGKQKTKAL